MGPLTALSVATQHTSLQEVAVVCSLLCTSKAVGAIVRQQCTGQLQLDISTTDVAQVQQLAAWLTSHGQLLRSLEFSVRFRKEPLEALALSHIAEALHVASEAAPLQLQSFKTTSDATGFLLQQLPVAHLTKLYFFWPWSATSSKHIISGLSILTGLRDLTIIGAPDAAYGGVTPVLSTLSSLTQLSRLFLEAHVRGLQQLELLPQHLQHLRIGLARVCENDDMSDVEEDAADDSDVPVHLGHLTALTYLDGISGENSYSVRQCDVLPPNLMQLRVTDVVSCEPLLQLQQLQQLRLFNTRTPAQQLQLLGRLTALTDVSLWYHDEDEDDVAVSSTAAAAWGVIPGLRRLGIWSNCGDTPLSAAVPKGVAQIRGLRQLDVHNHYMTRATAVQLMKAIKQLTSLQSLQLSDLQVYRLEGEVETAVPPENAAAGTYGKLMCIRHMAGAIAGLPQLQRLRLSHLPLGQGAAAALAGASQLTSLSLYGCRLDTDMVQSMLVKRAGLQHLELGGNKEVYSNCVNSIMQLSQLTYLGLKGTGMCILDLKCLTKLTNIKHCELPDINDVPW